MGEMELSDESWRIVLQTTVGATELEGEPGPGTQNQARIGAVEANLLLQLSHVYCIGPVVG